MREPHSKTYHEHLFRGPFPGRIDPWAEVGRYFHQIHAGMIGELLERLRSPLVDLGYVASRETSLQIVSDTQPDMSVWQVDSDVPQPTEGWSYSVAATEILAEPGISLTGTTLELDALYVRGLDTGDLVTLLEIISPANKVDRADMLRYQERRRNLVMGKGVNVVEFDFTRSVKRLIDDSLVVAYPYHVAVHLPTESSRFIGINFEHSIKRFALPLHNEVFPVETHEVYNHAYQQASIALQIQREGRYTDEHLQFPSLLTDVQRQEALTAAHAWQTKLAALRKPADG